MSNIRINDLPADQRPREKLVQHGPESLSDAELLAIFLRVGVKGQSAIQVGQRLLSDHGSLGAIARLDTQILAKEFGLGPAKAAQIAAAFEIGARVARENIQHARLDKPELIYKLIQPQTTRLSRESLFLLLTDHKLNHLKTLEISRGTANQTLCSIREILQKALSHGAYGFILAHNHPSGDPTPSQADHMMTKRVLEGAHAVELKFYDHVIIGTSHNNRQPYYSFAENGNLHL